MKRSLLLNLENKLKDMELVPSHVLYTIKLTDEESNIFLRKLPSNKDMELFEHIISERNTVLKIHTIEGLAIIDIEILFDIGTTFSDIKDIAKRIKKDIESFIDGGPFLD